MLQLAGDPKPWPSSQDDLELLHRKPRTIPEQDGGPCLSREVDLVRVYEPLLHDPRLLGGGWFEIADSGFSRFDGVWLQPASGAPPAVIEAKGFMSRGKIVGPSGSIETKLRDELEHWRTWDAALKRAASWRVGGKKTLVDSAKRELRRWTRQRFNCEWEELKFGPPDVYLCCTGLTAHALAALEELAKAPPAELNSLTLLVFRIPASSDNLKLAAGDAAVYRLTLIGSGR